MNVLTHAARLGSERAASSLEKIVLAIDDPDDERYDAGDEYGQAMRSAINMVRRVREIPLDLAARLTRAERPNVPYSGISAIAAHGNRQALDLLLSLRRELRDWHSRDSIEEAVETLSAKLGLVVLRQGKELVLPGDNPVEADDQR